LSIEPSGKERLLKVIAEWSSQMDKDPEGMKRKGRERYHNKVSLEDGVGIGWTL
jgi:hypothetical protein